MLEANKQEVDVSLLCSFNLICANFMSKSYSQNSDQE